MLIERIERLKGQMHREMASPRVLELGRQEWVEMEAHTLECAGWAPGHGFRFMGMDVRQLSRDRWLGIMGERADGTRVGVSDLSP